MKVKLFTADGGFVAEVEIAPFQTMPEVLIWGARVFVWHDDPASQIDGKSGYVEGFAYWVSPSAFAS